jgi:hypothetical protein
MEAEAIDGVDGSTGDMRGNLPQYGWFPAVDTVNLGGLAPAQPAQSEDESDVTSLGIGRRVMITSIFRYSQGQVQHWMSALYIALFVVRLTFIMHQILYCTACSAHDTPTHDISALSDNMQRLPSGTVQSAALYRVPKMPSCLALISDDDARQVSGAYLQATANAGYNLRNARCIEWNRHDARLPFVRAVVSSLAPMFSAS